jgi:large subunit ribosomal protein L29
MVRVAELRDMSTDQLEATLRETVEHFFRLRLQAQTERLDAPSELRKSRRLIARIKTIRNERERATSQAKQLNQTSKEE